MKKEQYSYNQSHTHENDSKWGKVDKLNRGDLLVFDISKVLDGTKLCNITSGEHKYDIFIEQNPEDVKELRKDGSISRDNQGNRSYFLVARDSEGHEKVMPAGEIAVTGRGDEELPTNSKTTSREDFSFFVGDVTDGNNPQDKNTLVIERNGRNPAKVISYAGFAQKILSADAYKRDTLPNMSLTYNQVGRQIEGAHGRGEDTLPTVLVRRSDSKITTGSLDTNTGAVYVDGGTRARYYQSLDKFSDQHQTKLAAELAGVALKGILDGSRQNDLSSSAKPEAAGVVYKGQEEEDKEFANLFRQDDEDDDSDLDVEKAAVRKKPTQEELNRKERLRQDTLAWIGNINKDKQRQQHYR